MRPQHLPNQHAHNFNNRGFRPNHHTHFQHELPPYPYSICTQQGIPNAYHWKLQCPFNQHQLRQTPFTCDSSLATNAVSQSSENSVSSQQILNQRQHPSTEASALAYCQLQVSGHISSLPSLANLDNLPKQNNVNIVIDTGSTLSLISADIKELVNTSEEVFSPLTVKELSPNLIQLLSEYSHVFSKNKYDVGYEIKEGCITPDNQNIETIKKLQPPKNIKQLQSCLGSVNVYNKLIDPYAKIREPLNQLLKKDKQWDWTAECQTAFELLKNKLITKLVLQLYDPKLPLHVFCDASLNAIGASLKQSDNSGTLYTGVILELNVIMKKLFYHRIGMFGHGRCS
ncbi:uncharacterized protein TNCV_4956291 [Trichonephila clavipes]|nr:uncharacterized protein TNCV_4956291 [Trichonephila clavipes]